MCELMGTFVITSVHRQYSICLVLTALWIDLAASYAGGDDRRTLLSFNRCGIRFVGGGASLCSVSQPTGTQLAGDVTKAPSYSAAARGDVGSHHTLPPLCFKAYSNLNKIIMYKCGLNTNKKL